MKKAITIAIATIMALSVLLCCAGCSDDTAQAKSDWDYIEAKGEMIIGITIFSPMNYYDDENNLIGFETEFATAVCEKLGVKPVFQVIDWNSKETELAGKNIDCIWNGMTIDAERAAAMDISTPYMENKQVLIALAENAAALNSAEALKDKSVVAELGSAGETVILSDDFFSLAIYTAVDMQTKALLEIKSGTADVAVVDYVMSIGSIGEGTDYADVAVVDGVEFAPEQYGIAFRKDSPETLQKVNAAIAELLEDGTLVQIAEKYKLDELLIGA